jgi:hypothetical protein
MLDAVTGPDPSPPQERRRGDKVRRQSVRMDEGRRRGMGFLPRAKSRLVSTMSGS